MTKTIAPSLDPNRKYGLIFVFEQLKRYVRSMKQCGEVETTKFQELLNEAAPWSLQNRTVSRKRIEVETHLMPLEMALMLGNSQIIKRCQNSLQLAIERLQAVCLAARVRTDVSKREVL